MRFKNLSKYIVLTLMAFISVFSIFGKNASALASGSSFTLGEEEEAYLDNGY